jgi:hypothetical protein
VSRADEPEGWAAALSRLLDDEGARSGAGAEARRWASAVHGSSACRMTVNRVLGWVQYEAQS